MVGRIKGLTNHSEVLRLDEFLSLRITFIYGTSRGMRKDLEETNYM